MRRAHTEEVRGALRSWVASIEKPPEDVLLWHPWDMLVQPFQLWVMSGYKVLPEDGGYFDQDMRLMSDFATLLGEYGRILEEEQERKQAANGHP